MRGHTEGHRKAEKAGEERMAMRHGTCELCGAHDRDLLILAQTDFIGWACEECIRQLWDCQVRRYCSAGEETEPGE